MASVIAQREVNVKERIEELIALRVEYREKLKKINFELGELGERESAIDIGQRFMIAVNSVLNTDIRLQNRKFLPVKGRQMYYKFMKDNTPLSLNAMALMGQDHSTVLHAIATFDDRYLTDKVFRSEYEQCLLFYENL